MMKLIEKMRTSRNKINKNVHLKVSNELYILWNLKQSEIKQNEIPNFKKFLPKGNQNFSFAK